MRGDLRVAVVRLPEQRPPLEVVARGHAGELEDRRRDVDLLHRTRDLAAARRAGQPDEERHVHDLLVQRLAVADTVVVEELFAVIAREDEDGPVEEAETREVVDEESERLVGGAHVAVVQVAQHRNPVLRHGRRPFTLMLVAEEVRAGGTDGGFLVGVRPSGLPERPRMPGCGEVRPVGVGRMNVEEERSAGRVPIEPAADTTVEDPSGQVRRRPLARPFGILVEFREATIETVRARHQ